MSLNMPDLVWEMLDEHFDTRFSVRRQELRAIEAAQGQGGTILSFHDHFGSSGPVPAAKAEWRL